MFTINNNQKILFSVVTVFWKKDFLRLQWSYLTDRFSLNLDLEIGEPFFPGSVSGLSSYAAYSIPAEIHQSFELSMHFVPNFMDQIALMMYIGHDASTDHVALSFIKGYIVLTWNLGAGARRIFTPKPINFQPKKAHVVKLGRDGKTAWLTVDNFPNVTGHSVGRLSQLNTKPVLYLGN